MVAAAHSIYFSFSNPNFFMEILMLSGIGLREYLQQIWIPGMMTCLFVMIHTQLLTHWQEKAADMIRGQQ
jgi:hypothetical protein